MRVWDTDPRLLCDKHLKAQHAEIHFAVGVIENRWSSKWKDIDRFRNHERGIDWLTIVHELTIDEMLRRRIVKDNWTPLNRSVYVTRVLRFWDPATMSTPFYMKCMLDYGYPPTELKHGTPWERDGVSFEWYREHEKDWTRELARLENLRSATIAA